MGDSAICWRAAAAAGGGGCGGGCDIAGGKFGHGWMEYAMLVDRDFFVDFLSGAREAWR